MIFLANGYIEESIIDFLTNEIKNPNPNLAGYTKKILKLLYNIENTFPKDKANDEVKLWFKTFFGNPKKHSFFKNGKCHYG